MTKAIKVFGFEISEKAFPKLYELGKRDYARLKIVLALVQEYCPKGDWAEIASKVENSRSVKIGKVEVDVFSYPAVFCWYVYRQREFEKFFGETVERLWQGDEVEAIRMMEEYFERGMK